MNFMVNIAAKLTRKSQHDTRYHACIIVRGGAIVSMGYNTQTTHAEISALNKMWPSERKGTKLWSIRLDRNGGFAMAKPCPKCEAAIRAAGVKQVFYTDQNGQVQKMKL